MSYAGSEELRGTDLPDMAFAENRALSDSPESSAGSLPQALFGLSVSVPMPETGGQSLALTFEVEEMLAAAAAGDQPVEVVLTRDIEEDGAQHARTVLALIVPHLRGLPGGGVAEGRITVAVERGPIEDTEMARLGVRAQPPEPQDLGDDRVVVEEARRLLLGQNWPTATARILEAVRHERLDPRRHPDRPGQFAPHVVAFITSEGLVGGLYAGAPRSSGQPGPSARPEAGAPESAGASSSAGHIWAANSRGLQASPPEVGPSTAESFGVPGMPGGFHGSVSDEQASVVGPSTEDGRVDPGGADHTSQAEQPAEPSGPGVDKGKRPATQDENRASDLAAYRAVRDAYRAALDRRNEGAGDPEADDAVEQARARLEQTEKDYYNNWGARPDADLERQDLPSASEFPTTLPEMTEMAHARGTNIDTGAIAAFYNRRPYGKNALTGGRVADSHAAVRGEFSDEDAKAFMRAAGLSDQDIDKLRWTSYKSGSVYPGASLVGNLLQYLLVPGIGVAFGSTAAVGASSVFVMASMLLSAGLQPLVITLSEQIAKYHGPYVEVDKSKINYQVPLSEATRQVDQASQQYPEAVQRLRTVSTAAGLDVASMAKMSWTDFKKRLFDLDPAVRVRLGQAAEEVANHELHEKLEQLFAAQGGLQRQQIGNAWQVPGRSARAPLSTALGFLTGARPGDGGGVAEGMRVQRVSPNTQVGLQGLVNLTLQGIGHLVAGIDEYNKVWFKSSLNLMYADLLTSAGHQRWARGEPVSGSDIDAQRVAKLFSSPPQAIGAVVSKKFQAEVNALRQVPGSEAVVATLERELELVAQGNFDQLDRTGRIAQAMTNAASGLTWNMIRDEAWSKYTWNEMTAQLVQRFTQAWHMLMLGSGPATVLPRAVAAAYGGTAHLSSAALGILMATSGFMGFAAATTQHKSATDKNNHKEMAQPESLGTQIGKGVGALYYLWTENMASASVGERAAEVLRRSRSDFNHAVALLDGLEEVAEPARLFQELPGYDAAWMSDPLDAHPNQTPPAQDASGAPEDRNGDRDPADADGDDQADAAAGRAHRGAVDVPPRSAHARGAGATPAVWRRRRLGPRPMPSTPTPTPTRHRRGQQMPMIRPPPPRPRPIPKLHHRWWSRTSRPCRPIRHPMSGRPNRMPGWVPSRVDGPLRHGIPVTTMGRRRWCSQSRNRVRRAAL